MRKIDSLKVLAGFRLVSAVAVSALTLTGMLFTDSIASCLSVCFIGSGVLFMVDGFFSD